MAELTGKDALDFFEGLKRQDEQQRGESLEREKRDAVARGKEPFDFEKLEKLCDTSSEGRLDPLEQRRATHVEHHIERVSKW